MLQVFYADVIKIDLDVAMLHVFHTHVVIVLSGCFIFNERFECSMQHEIDVAAKVFLIIYGWLITFSTYLFDVANDDCHYSLMLQRINGASDDGKNFHQMSGRKQHP